MKFNDHGAETNNIYKEFNLVKPEKTIDFSTNTNVIELTSRVKSIIETIDLSAYPDASNSQVIQSIVLNIMNASDCQIAEENILVTNGSNEAIYIIASYFANMEVAIFQPTYPEYEKAFKAYNAKVNYCFDLDELVNNKFKCVYICNPNNPTGKYIKWNDLLKVIEQVDLMGNTLVIDEAYIDFLLIEDKEAKDKYKYCINHKNIIILRSLTKIYQIAGLRLAYVMSHTDWIKKIQRRQPSWSVNSLASSVAGLYLGDNTIVKATKKFYRQETKRVIQELLNLGFEVVETCVNFYLLKIADDVKLIKYLLSCGIIIRHTRNHPGLDGAYVRIAVRSEQDNNYLLHMLKNYGLLD